MWGCANPSEEDEIENGLEPVEIFFVFDPTVLDPTQDRSMRSWLERFESFCKVSLPESSRLSLFVVGKGVFQSPPFRHYEVGEQHGVNYEQAFRAEVEKVCADARAELLELWWEVHAEPIEARSCLLSAIARVQDATKTQAADRKRLFLVLASDLLEVCDESGRLINLERSRHDLSIIMEEDHHLDLKLLEGVLVVQFASAHYVTPNDHRELRHAWTTMLNKAGLKDEQITIRVDFPESYNFRGKAN